MTGLGNTKERNNNVSYDAKLLMESFECKCKYLIVVTTTDHFFSTAVKQDRLERIISLRKVSRKRQVIRVRIVPRMNPSRQQVARRIPRSHDLLDFSSASLNE